jgi:hypothetical protein
MFADHNSTEPVMPMLMPFITAGIVVYNYFVHVPWSSSHGSVKLWAHQQCARLWGEHHVGDHHHTAVDDDASA